MAMLIQLKVFEGGKLKAARVFRSEQIRLGSASSDLLLEGPGVLPNHAVIDAGAQGAILRSVGPAPLYLNGQPILAAPLRHGDLISVGELRVMVELRAAAMAQLDRRPHLQLIQGEEEPEADPVRHAPPLSVVREPEPFARSISTIEARSSDAGIHAHIPELPATLAPPPPPPIASAGATATAPQLAEVVPLRGPPPLPAAAVQGGDCVEAELFWGSTRISVWQLAPGEQLVAGEGPGCDALLEGVDRAAVVRCDSNGWVVCAPRPLSLTVIENGRSVGGPELLVRGRSQADAKGLLLPLPQKAVA